MPAPVKITFGNTVRDFDVLTRNTSKLVEKEVEKIIKRIGKRMLARVKRLTPRRTGRLRKAWRGRQRETRFQTRYELSNRTSYASFVENGTKFMVPRKMLQNTVKWGENELKKALAKLSRKVQSGWGAASGRGGF